MWTLQYMEDKLLIAIPLVFIDVWSEKVPVP